MSGVGRLGGRDKRLGGNQLGQFPQVLGSGGEQELVTGARGPAEPQPIETQRSQDDQGRRIWRERRTWRELRFGS